MACRKLSPLNPFDFRPFRVRVERLDKDMPSTAENFSALLAPIVVVTKRPLAAFLEILVLLLMKIIYHDSCLQEMNIIFSV